MDVCHGLLLLHSQRAIVLQCCRCGSSEVRSIGFMEVAGGCGVVQHVSASIKATNKGTV